MCGCTRVLATACFRRVSSLPRWNTDRISKSPAPKKSLGAIDSSPASNLSNWRGLCPRAATASICSAYLKSTTRHESQRAGDTRGAAAGPAGACRLTRVFSGELQPSHFFQGDRNSPGFFPEQPFPFLTGRPQEGLHYQIRQPQGKLVSVVCGAVFTVAVDLRRSSVTFARWVGAELTEDNHHQLWIPPGFAHGFLVLSTSAGVHYKATDTTRRSLSAASLGTTRRWPFPGRSRMGGRRCPPKTVLASALRTPRFSPT